MNKTSLVIHLFGDQVGSYNQRIQENIARIEANPKAMTGLDMLPIEVAWEGTSGFEYHKATEKYGLLRIANTRDSMFLVTSVKDVSDDKELYINTFNRDQKVSRTFIGFGVNPVDFKFPNDITELDIIAAFYKAAGARFTVSEQFKAMFCCFAGYTEDSEPVYLCKKCDFENYVIGKAEFSRMFGGISDPDRKEEKQTEFLFSMSWAIMPQLDYKFNLTFRQYELPLKKLTETEIVGCDHNGFLRHATIKETTSGGSVISEPVVYCQGGRVEWRVNDGRLFEFPIYPETK